MEPIFIYYNNLNFDQDKNFTLEFSDSDKLDGVIFKKRLLYNKHVILYSFDC